MVTLVTPSTFRGNVNNSLQGQTQRSTAFSILSDLRIWVCVAVWLLPRSFLYMSGVESCVLCTAKATYVQVTTLDSTLEMERN